MWSGAETECMGGVEASHLPFVLLKQFSDALVLREDCRNTTAAGAGAVALVRPCRVVMPLGVQAPRVRWAERKECHWTGSGYDRGTALLFPAFSY